MVLNVPSSKRRFFSDQDLLQHSQKHNARKRTHSVFGGKPNTLQTIDFCFICLIFGHEFFLYFAPTLRSVFKKAGVAFVGCSIDTVAGCVGGHCGSRPGCSVDGARWLFFLVGLGAGVPPSISQFLRHSALVGAILARRPNVGRFPDGRREPYRREFSLVLCRKGSEAPNES